MANYTVYFGEQSFDMVPGAYMVDNEQLEITIFGENLSLDYVENIVRNKENLKLIRIFNNKSSLVTRFNKYTEFERLEKNPHYLLQTYSDEGEYNPIYGETIRIIVRTPKITDQFNKLEATMEYMAIMADIDIDEE